MTGPRTVIPQTPPLNVTLSLIAPPEDQPDAPHREWKAIRRYDAVIVGWEHDIALDRDGDSHMTPILWTGSGKARTFRPQVDFHYSIRRRDPDPAA